MITPASKIKWDKNRDKIFSEGHIIVEVTHFCLNITVHWCVGIILNVAAEFITEYKIQITNWLSEWNRIFYLRRYFDWIQVLYSSIWSCGIAMILDDRDHNIVIGSSVILDKKLTIVLGSFFLFSFPPIWRVSSVNPIIETYKVDYCHKDVFC